MKLKCRWCGKEWDEDELDMDEHDDPHWCPECGHDDFKVVDAE